MQVFFILLLFLLTSCAKNPATNNLDIVTLTEQQEYDLARASRKNLVKNSDIYKDENLQKYISDLTHKVYNEGERPEKDLIVYLLNSDEANAYALPGYIMVYRGIFPYLQDEAGLIGVLGHEAGHINARHMAQKQSNAFLISWFLNSINIHISKLSKEFIKEHALLHYSRANEYEADELAVRYLNKLEVPAENMMYLNKSMAIKENISLKMQNLNQNNKKQVFKVPEYKRTHPLSKKRIKAITDKTNKWFEFVKPYNQAKFYKMIDGVPYGYKGSSKKSEIITDSDVKDFISGKSGVYGFKNIAYFKSKKLKMVMPKDYQARIMSSDPIGYNYKKDIIVGLDQFSDDKNIYPIDIISEILGLDRKAKNKLKKQIQSQNNVDFINKNLKQGEQIYSYSFSPSIIDKLLGKNSSYYYFYIKELAQDESKASYMKHFRIITLYSNSKKSFDETMLNDILSIKDNVVELTKEQAGSIKPLAIKTKQLENSKSIDKLSSENIPYIYYKDEWFRLFNGIYDELQTGVEKGTWLKLIPNPNKNI
jgi:predicted Zn-dependent protease